MLTVRQIYCWLQKQQPQIQMSRALKSDKPEGGVLAERGVNRRIENKSK